MIFSSCIVSADKNETGSDIQPSWSGVWESLLYTETLEQNKTNVTGTYVPFTNSLKDNGIINGTLTNNGSRLTGSWTETGDVLFNVSNDNSTLDGVWAYSDEVQQFLKMDSNNDIDGTWNSSSLSLNLQKKDSLVFGTYESIDDQTGVSGFINATVSPDGKEITGTFNESGNILFILSDDGSYYNGTYTYGNKPQKEVDTWNATRIK
ncbi:hypothetical protein [Methanospirillum lacunae]|uniref:Uncharacterized protein n=1 Tax=Methanospirillum lacunae TaxID=668570 RepID=A0A2V2NG76_9EURY|nr:hypothetical protein [Methanospirillum lacunae]PWR74323.1 hypothetical protein DK846_04025 [Methanospirillum lacunae]